MTSLCPVRLLIYLHRSRITAPNNADIPIRTRDEHDACYLIFSTAVSSLLDEGSLRETILYCKRDSWSKQSSDAEAVLTGQSFLSSPKPVLTPPTEATCTHWGAPTTDFGCRKELLADPFTCPQSPIFFSREEWFREQLIGCAHLVSFFPCLFILFTNCIGAVETVYHCTYPLSS